jgi:hypothetical protein
MTAKAEVRGSEKSEAVEYCTAHWPEFGECVGDGGADRNQIGAQDPADGFGDRVVGAVPAD